MAFDIKAYARRGAETRVAELSQELESIYGAFPELRAQASANAGVVTRRDGEASLALGAAEETPRRRRWNMSAAQKRAVSQRMKRYWAGRRRAKKGD